MDGQMETTARAAFFTNIKRADKLLLQMQMNRFNPNCYLNKVFLTADPHRRMHVPVYLVVMEAG